MNTRKLYAVSFGDKQAMHCLALFDTEEAAVMYKGDISCAANAYANAMIDFEKNKHINDGLENRTDALRRARGKFYDLLGVRFGGQHFFEDVCATMFNTVGRDATTRELSIKYHMDKFLKEYLHVGVFAAPLITGGSDD